MIFPDLIIIIHNPIPHLISFKLYIYSTYIVVPTNLKKLILKIQKFEMIKQDNPLVYTCTPTHINRPKGLHAVTDYSNTQAHVQCIAQNV